MENKAPIDPVGRFVERLQREEVNLHGFLFSVSGRTVAGAYYAPFREGQPHRLYSISKTFTGIAVGMLAEEGRLSLDDFVVRYFPDWLPDHPSKYLLHLKLRDMLRMATCYRRTAYREGVDENWALSFFTGTPDHEPGTVFAYDTGCSQVLAALVKRLSGQDVMDYLEERLFRPLGCQDPRYWLRDPSGCCQGGTGLCMSLRDLHRAALCLLNGGEGIIPGWYVREMSKKHIDTLLQDKKEERFGYGWQCWRTRSGWAMYGMGGQLSIFSAEKQAVLSTIADTRLDPCGVQKIYDAYYEEIDPFVQPGGALGWEAPARPAMMQLPAPRLFDCASRPPAAPGDYLFPVKNALGLRQLCLRESEILLKRSGQTARLPFRRGETLVSSFPGHPQIPATISAGWAEQGLLHVRCHAIGDAPCGFEMVIFLKDGTVTVQSRCSSDPLTRGYDGIASGVLQKGGPA